MSKRKGQRAKKMTAQSDASLQAVTFSVPSAVLGGSEIVDYAE